MGDAKAAAEPKEPARLVSLVPSLSLPSSRPLVTLADLPGRGADDARVQSYPRPGGIVVPPELARFCQGVVTPPRAVGKNVSADLAAEDLALIAARAVVQRMARAAYALPRPLLELRLPSPSLVLQTYVLDDRTRRVLERAAPMTKTKTWTLAAYLELPRFGPFCLVDLLAARSEAALGLGVRRNGREALAARGKAPPEGEDAGGARALPLDELSSLLMRAMPLGGDQIAKLLGREGSSLSAPTVRELARAYRSAGRTVPFRVIRHGGCEVVVAPSVRNVARMVLVAATQFISWWGLTTVQQIVTRTQLRAASSVSAAFAGRVLASFPKIVWLDQSKEWFSFRGNSSSLLRAVRKAFAAAERVELPSLGKALTKEKALLAKLPAGVWERYLSAIAGYSIDGIWVRRQPGDDALCPV